MDYIQIKSIQVEIYGGINNNILIDRPIDKYTLQIYIWVNIQVEKRQIDIQREIWELNRQTDKQKVTQINKNGFIDTNTERYRRKGFSSTTIISKLLQSFPLSSGKKNKG